MSAHIRPFTSADYPVMAEIINQQMSEPVTAERLEQADNRRPATAIVTRLIAADSEGRVLGYAGAGGGNPMPPGRFSVRVRVRNEDAGQGTGRLLWNALTEWLQEQGAQALEVGIREQDERSLAIAKRQGFVQTYHLFESTLALPTWSPSPWLGAVASAEASGFRFTTMAELGMTDEWLKRAYEADERMGHDVPSNEQMGAIPYEDWLRIVKDDPNMPPEGIHVALDGEQIAALAFVTRQESGALYNGFTGVDRPYRGRGLALATKVQALRWAKSTGAPYIRTNNHSVNGPMLAVNRKLGYIPEPGWFTLEKKLS